MDPLQTKERLLQFEEVKLVLGTFEERPREQMDIDSQVVDTSRRSELVVAVVQ